MRFTNKHGLHRAFVRAVENDPYSKGLSDYTATSLASPARQSALITKHFDEIEVDVSTRVASIIGSGAHAVVERAARPGIDIKEERFYFDIEVDSKTYKIGAQVDLYETDTKALMDWKTTKAYAFSKKAGSGQKPDWRQQLNIGAEALRRNNHEVKSLEIIAMLKDFNKRNAGTDSCPATEVVTVDIPMWEQDKILNFITNRIRAHERAKTDLPLCTPDETWQGKRCVDWCDAKSVCTQYMEMAKTGLINKGE